MLKNNQPLKFATIDNGVYDQYLGQCDLEVEVLAPILAPATLYNQVLDRSSGLVGFIHSDVTCAGLREAIELTPFKGAMGVVGAGTKWGKMGTHFRSPTCDSCFILVDADRKERFDDKTFDGFHLYVEDYCVQVGGCTIMDINCYLGMGELFKTDERYIIHHTVTLKKLGCAWGDYNDYKMKLFKKWGRIISTT